MNNTIKAQDLLRIHAIACNTWKEKISNYLTRIDEDQDVTFSDKEINEMFNAATDKQRQTLVEIFGNPMAEIDYDRIKTGSVVMIRETGKHCSGEVDYTLPVDVVFYITSHGINGDGSFFNMGAYRNGYVTFHQDGKYVLFGDDDGEINYITQVIKY